MKLLLLLPSLAHAFVRQVRLVPRASQPTPGTTGFTRMFAETKEYASSESTTTSNDSIDSKIPYKFYNSTMPPRTAQLQSYQARHAEISSSFVPTTFSPPPLLSNKHLQTIGGVFLRTNCAYYSNISSVLSGIFNTILNIQQNEYLTATNHENWYYDKRERIITPGGGAFFTVDHKYYKPDVGKDAESRGTVIIIHGLESNSNSTLCTDMSTAFLQKGYDVSVLNFRGCCGTDVSKLYQDGTLVKNGENSLMYHLGFVDDLIYYLSLLAARSRDNAEKKPIYLSGFSLGANVVLKALGQMGTDAIDLYNVAGASVAGAPFDTERNYLQFHQDPISRLVYVESLLNKLKERAREILEVQYDGNVNASGFDYQGSIDANTIYDLETACVAPLFGFDDHIDYYRKTSCGYFLDRICVPTYVVNAMDDPFFDSSYVPWDKVYGGESCDGSSHEGAPIKIALTKEGGHLGYIFHQMDDDSSNGETRKASWISKELARFIDHAHGEIHSKERPLRVGVGLSLPLL
ncbi:hypothetical protein ACHAXN_001075 [Cyclotella atomus]